MAGFLDKETRVVDMVLTLEGRRLQSEGELRFVYFALFDDEVDYDPYISASGSMNSDDLSSFRQEQIENALVREATTGYRGSNTSGSDFTNVHLPLFTMPQGSRVLPRVVSVSEPPGSFSLTTKIRKHQDMYLKKNQTGGANESVGPFDTGYERFDPSTTNFQYTFRPGEFFDQSHRQGMLVRIFKSGSEGLIEVPEKRDMLNDISYQNDLKLTIDGTGVKPRGSKD